MENAPVDSINEADHSAKYNRQTGIFKVAPDYGAPSGNLRKLPESPQRGGEGLSATKLGLPK
jgi:hypothetical protein